MIQEMKNYSLMSEERGEVIEVDDFATILAEELTKTGAVFAGESDGRYYISTSRAITLAAETLRLNAVLSNHEGGITANLINHA